VSADARTPSLEALLAQRAVATPFFDREADRIAELCRRCAERFLRGGRLVALGRSPQARSDARHVAVEFVHPVIVGKRALPALALCAEGGPLDRQARLALAPDDVVIAFEAGDRETAAALAVAAERGCETVAFAAVPATTAFAPPGEDRVRQEIAETLYHVVWELVHVVLEHRGTTAAGGGASSFLYPFLSNDMRDDLDAVLADIARSVRRKAREVEQLRVATVEGGAEALHTAADVLRERLDGGGRVLALGNGGSATDAMDVVADLRDAGRAALDLTEDTSIITAIANDVGVEAVFLRQVIAHGRDGDALLAFSTSGGSPNVIAALAEARRRGVHTVAFAGYDGGPIAAGQLADEVIVTPSQHIPRIQEAQATAYHALVDLIGASA
jgi:D-sedoheptulose 7-phosphate isomerase